MNKQQSRNCSLWNSLCLELNGLQKPQSLVDASSDGEIVDDDLPHHTLCIDGEIEKGLVMAFPTD